MTISATGILSLTCEVVQVPFDHVADGADYELALRARQITCMISHSFGLKDAAVALALSGVSTNKVRHLRHAGDLACEASLVLKEIYQVASHACATLDKKLEEAGVELNAEINPRATADLLINKRERFAVSIAQMVNLARAYTVVVQERDELIALLGATPKRKTKKG